MIYVHATTAGDLPEFSAWEPCKVILIAECTSGCGDLETIATWVVNSGGVYMMAWGENCRAWQDAVNLGNLQSYDFGTIPDERLIITTSHPGQTLAEVFWFAKNTAMHPCHSKVETVLLHVAEEGQKDELMVAFNAA